MKAADHPARRPPGTRPFTAAEEDAPRETNAPMGLDPPRHSDDEDTSEEVPAPDIPVDNMPTREPIETAPQDGRDVIVYFGDLDNEGRLVRYRAGRRFTGRRWVEGGKWVPTDSTIPLPGVEPTAWLRYPQADAEPAAA